jgi:shikimate dehydrogenase
MQNAALCAAGLDYVYLAFPIPPESFEKAARGLAAAGMVGLNCTVPHKHAALALCDEVSEEARLVGAVNTLSFRADGSIYGTNTDVEGYVETLRQDGGFDFSGKKVLQLGAGGAGRGMALGAVRSGARELILVNRTREKAESLAADLRQLFPGARITVLSQETESEDALRGHLESADLVTNATSLGLRDTDPMPCDPESLPIGGLVFDAAYTAQRSTAWLRGAAERGCRTLDGLGMLVRQGAASFRLWTGAEPDLRVMFAALPGG